ncbi:16S rRNA (guanine(966)-N(2))-methyltransferase RsmD [Zymomonas mobilis]|uniref:Methyltransferase n=1 Tax=Zymomonas mobilis subsp. mobilis (strain ATCC 10988 / DSM 424 / LMG 404 / NCIMB 8938 / NRRL B-806 / ZM1) TaxID=555217 RepID=A0A0H3FYS8_ZYMMA|nr:16S rRNA (guanine(966)-N(2))-methyltransferase RsmD [Zymomonas mobilis]AEH62935.1 methyltransferase [Zymomonas mobilis subsp. mobilis ATCC 10988]AHB10013.1 RNA methyltransferase, RsmD family [Zymomonas mobilis subsp. mobilis str. CP4 = NRRL B-14023]AHJ70319.1 Ribosomal RNA small subunit methyltransferase D [Zymomonas mobilis subsp. mobilis NRRL B-12526]AHJ72174.1 Ribosomal RNA small subunit methyltransferase D [Zymomonas mobilis subsp. mobilis str. CP4 = NRRL B-14023]ART93173.1 16S rRNA (gu
MRIIAGKWRGRSLKTPNSDTTRPTSDRAREALFSMLESRMGSLESLRVADIFAGTGALGLESLSRGAAFSLFVEQDPEACKILKSNIEKMGAQADTRLMAQPVSSLAPISQPFDLLLFDPPYNSGGAGALLEKLTRLGWASPSAWASIETAKQETTSAGGWVVEAERTYGKSRVTLLRRVAES